MPFDYLPVTMELLGRSHSPFHAVYQMQQALLSSGFTKLEESKRFDVRRGGKYFITRNGTSIIAFMIPENAALGLRLAATHNDSPTFAVKPNPVLKKGSVTSINVEPYGGGIYYSWFDRPLSMAGRVIVNINGETFATVVDIDEDILIIPSLAIHQNREVNKGYEFNAARDMVPLWLDHDYEGDFSSYLMQKCGIEEGEIIAHDLSLYVREEPRLICEGSLLVAPRLDDLASSYTSLLGFIEACENKTEGYIPVFVSLDNEEVGSLTAQGANSDFLRRTLNRLFAALELDEDEKGIALTNSIMLSVDNAHANHPNHPEKADPTTKVALNGGIVIKYNADQRYTSNSLSAAYVKNLAAKLGQPIQEFTNRSDLRGGSTLGNISNSEVSILSADIGIAQLAMHSCVETCGAEDIARMAALLKAHYLG